MQPLTDIVPYLKRLTIMGSSKVSLLNIKFDNPGFEQALIDFNTKRFTVTPNIDHLYNLQHNRGFWKLTARLTLFCATAKLFQCFRVLPAGNA